MTSFPLRHLALAIGTLCLTGQIVAQMDPGFIGKRYVGASFFLEHVNDMDLDLGTGVQGTANLPVASFLDISGYASHESFSTYDISDDRLGGMLVAYADLEYYKPFLNLGVVGTWQSSKIGSTTYERHDGIYVAGLGVEAAVGRHTAVVLRADYNKYFDTDNGDYWTYTAGINTWFNEKVGGVFSVGFNESETIVYNFGMIFRF